MKTELKYIGVGLVIVMFIVFLVCGAALPFLKSQRYIQAINSLGSVRSVEGFRANYNNVFDFYSPIGDEEIAKFFGTDMINFVKQNSSEAVARELADYADARLLKDNVRHLIILGQIYFALWSQYGNPTDYERARDYYLEALSIGPKLPPVLYGLWDIYRIGGETERAKEIAKRILLIWPEDLDMVKSLHNLEQAKK